MGLRELRKEKGFTLHSLADASGVNYMKIHQIETGKINPQNIALKTAVKLANALGCYPEDIMSAEVQRPETEADDPGGDTE